MFDGELDLSGEEERVEKGRRRARGMSRHLSSTLAQERHVCGVGEVSRPACHESATRGAEAKQVAL